MLFFYVGIGFGMIATIIAMFETTMFLNKNNFVNYKKSVPINQSILRQQNDMKFLQLLNDLNGVPLGSGKEICQNIKSGFTDELNNNYIIFSKYSALNTYEFGIESNTNHSRLNGACNLVNDSHRVILVPDSTEINSYNLYSCVTNIEPNCTFELSK